MSYGQSFARKYVQEGKWELALVEADKERARDADDPEPVFARAEALAALERFDEAVEAFVETFRLDGEAAVMDDSLVDDALFSTLVAWARATANVDEAVAIVRRYPSLLPAGGHLADVDVWERRLRGERIEWVKAR